eukprot:COSAG01_NODE_43192_length_432_cov_0.984985_1_plen_57_part_10
MCIVAHTLWANNRKSAVVVLPLLSECHCVQDHARSVELVWRLCSRGGVLCFPKGWLY